MGLFNGLRLVLNGKNKGSSSYNPYRTQFREKLFLKLTSFSLGNLHRECIFNLMEKACAKKFIFFQL